MAARYFGTMQIDVDFTELIPKGNMQTGQKNAILVFHSLDQLAFKDEALALMTMNNSFTFYNSWLVDGAAYVQTCYYELRKFKLGPISKLENDLEKDTEDLKLPPGFTVNGQEFAETDKKIQETWNGLRSEIRIFMGIIWYVVDKEIARNHEAAYISGWVEPNFSL
ncbi:MAG: hypothetical protein MJE68_04120 [Proteobacteria bacterium]|nr:hypothetical protein [Pseudomonadota bacterium]